MSIAAIILAAGSSQRLGRPKQNVMLAGETLLQRAIRIADEACLSPIIVVTRSAIDTDPSGTQAIEFVVNPNPDEGLASSIRCAVAAISSREIAGAIIMACDQPAVTAAHLRALCAEQDRVTGSRYARAVGVPAYFPNRSFGELLQLTGDSGARMLLQTAHSIPAENLEFDIDTQQDLDRARTLFEPDLHEAS